MTCENVDFPALGQGPTGSAGQTGSAPPSERLHFVLSGDQPHRASEWADTPGRSLEEQLAEIAQEVTLRGEAAERRRQDEIEAARQKRIRWKAAMEEARVQYAESYRVRHFEAQEAAWRHATRLTRYVSAARTRVEAMPPGQTRTEAEAWISCATATVERLDPLNAPPRLPDIPEPRADDLKPFLGHWSPYGPTYRAPTPPDVPADLPSSSRKASPREHTSHPARPARSAR
ncbi:hypothetical protein [Streptomyces wedmorensis]